MTSGAETGGAGVAVTVERWPTEIPLLLLVVAASLGIWALLAITLVGIVYAVLIALALFVAHVSFVAYVRGNGVRLGPEQFPEIHERVETLARAAGLARAPEAYVLQQGGALNAFATRLFRTPLLVLFSDLLDACGENAAARDMVIGHELGHVKAGHLSFAWLLAPGMIVPFLGHAYSQAREYTCDRWGAALCGDRQGALTGLAILAAGGQHGPRVNLRSLAGQRRDLDTGFMKLGTWLSTHPPLCERVVALEPSLGDGQGPFRRGVIRALALLASMALLPTAVGAAGMLVVWPRIKATFDESRARATAAGAAAPRRVQTPGERAAAQAKAEADLHELQNVVEEAERRLGRLPADDDALWAAWQLLRPGRDLPVDPFDKSRYGYVLKDGHYTLWSSGPDGESGTDDDIDVRSDGPDGEPVSGGR